MKRNYYIAASAILILMIIAVIYLGERRYKVLSKELSTQALAEASKNPQGSIIDKDNPDKDPKDNSQKDPKDTETSEYEEIEGISFLITEKVMKSTTSINVRRGPGTSFPILGSLSANKQVTVTAIGENNWARISFDGQEGFCNIDYLKEEQ